MNEKKSTVKSQAHDPASFLLLKSSKFLFASCDGEYFVLDISETEILSIVKVGKVLTCINVSPQFQ